MLYIFFCNRETVPELSPTPGGRTMCRPQPAALPPPSTATPALGSALCSRSAAVPCAGLIRKVIYRGQSPFPAFPRGGRIQQGCLTAFPGVGCGSALPYAAPGDAPRAAGVCQPAPRGRFPPGGAQVRPHSSARAPAAALEHHREYNHGRNRAFWRQDAGRGCIKGTGQPGSVPRGSQCVPAPAARPCPAPHPAGGEIPAVPTSPRCSPRQRCRHRGCGSGRARL